ncbi:MAG: ABC transporter permease [Terriglobales bacterium]
MHELRLAFRRLTHERAFALVAILTLAVGIGANTAIFSIVDGVLLRPLDFPQPQQLVALNQSIPQFAGKYPYFPVNAASYHQWQQHSKLLANIAVLQPNDWVLASAGNEPRQVYGAIVSASMFPTLGVKLHLGRNFTAAEDQPGKNREIIISAAFWRSEFHADPAIVGKAIDLDGAPNMIVGVLPASLHFPHGAELGSFFGSPSADHPMQVFRPAGINFTNAQNVGNYNYFALARMQPGVTPARLRAELNVLEANFLAASHAPAHLQVNTVVTPLRDQLVGNHGVGLWLLLAAVGAILLIVCLNLANLLLVRVTGRAHELAIRVALGASRGRLVKETVTEGLALAAAGGAVGILAAWAALRWLVHAAPAGIPRLDEVGLDPAVLVFAIALALLCGVLFSLWPALRSANTDPQAALRAGGRNASDSGKGLRTRTWLVGAQAALAALLLIVAGLLTASYMDLLGVNKGFQENNVIVTGITWPGNHAQRAAFYHGVLEKLSALPGVQAVGMIDDLPTQGTNDTDLLSRPHDTRPLVDRPLSIFSSVSPDYFAAVGIPLLRGRTFTDAEVASALQVELASANNQPISLTQAPRPGPPMAAIVSATTAREIWPGQNPIGQVFRNADPTGPEFHLIGVVADVRTVNLEQKPGLQIYLPYTYNEPGGMAIALRTNAPLSALAPRIRSAIWSVQPAAAIDKVATLSDIVASSVAGRRFQMGLVLAFALCALFLAALGIYGVIAYSVERRAGEISIRMTMGAQASHLVRMVMRQGLTPVIAGLALGIIAALASGKLLASLLFAVHASDPTVIAAVAILLLAVGALACALPAWRAARINPNAVLRT